MTHPKLYRETKEQEASIRTLQNDMTKLNVLINKKTGEKETKQQDTILMENDFIETLREHEAKSIAMQVKWLVCVIGIACSSCSNIIVAAVNS